MKAHMQHLSRRQGVWSEGAPSLLITPCGRGVNLYAAATGELTGVLEGHTGDVTCVVLDPRHAEQVCGGVGGGGVPRGTRRFTAAPTLTSTWMCECIHQHARTWGVARACANVHACTRARMPCSLPCACCREQTAFII